MKTINSFSLQKKLIMVFLLTSVTISITNFFLFLNLNSALRKIDSLYMSNVQINTLSDTLTHVQESLRDFLDTRSTGALENYFRYEQSYQNQLDNLNETVNDNDMDMMEKNIRSLSTTYLSTADATMQAKRGRNIEKYRSSYAEATRIFGYINTYIYSLNNTEFKYNADNYNTLRNSFHTLELVSFLILIMVTLVNLVLIAFLTRTITDPLQQLAQNANQISSGNFDVPMLNVASTDEIGIVSSAFNQMVISIRGYIDRIKSSMEHENQMREKELLMDSSLKEAELKYLQAQVNPHFLFNTLNAGAQLAMMEDANITYDYIQNVASFFRYKINRDKQVSTLKEEIALVDNYMYIINVRFAGEIHYNKIVDDDLTEIYVPSMILQPLVENSINHGLRDITWERKLLLSVYRVGQEVCVSIKDNGRGISAEQVTKLLNGHPEINPGENGNGVGLMNVVERLRIFYNCTEVFDINSGDLNKGTEIILYLPIQGGKEHHV